jgi:tRNA U34 2-thiouridine synthase MnmA/TrmU
LYVIALDYKNSTVIVGEKQYLEQKVPVKVSNFNKLSNFEGEITAAIRYNQTPQKIKKVEQISSNSYLFYFQNVISSVAPGQMLVAYNKDRVIGGGIIEK